MTLFEDLNLEIVTLYSMSKLPKKVDLRVKGGSYQFLNTFSGKNYHGCMIFLLLDWVPLIGQY